MPSGALEKISDGLMLSSLDKGAARCTKDASTHGREACKVYKGRKGGPDNEVRSCDAEVYPFPPSSSLPFLPQPTALLSSATAANPSSALHEFTF